jgi:hypothetical protein
MAKAFLQTIGSAAKAAPKGRARPASARIEAQTTAQPTPEAPPTTTISMDELLRRRRERERERAAKLEAFGRRNQEAWLEQSAMIDAARRF